MGKKGQDELKKTIFVKPGLRMIKTVIAVLLCFFIVAIPSDTSNGFYAAIAAILCMQFDIQSSWQIARNRIFGTLIGGAYGLFMMEINVRFNLSSQRILFFLIIGLSLLPLIYLMVILRQSAAVYITCVVYLSLVLSLSNRPPLSFAIMRTGETLVGIFVSLGVNWIPFLRHRLPNGPEKPGTA